MSSATAESEAPNAVINSSDDVVPQALVEERVIADETVLLEESVVVEEATVTRREVVPGNRHELEEGECSDTDSEDADYSMVSDTYDETLDLGHNVPNNIDGLLSSVRQGQQQQSRASSSQGARQLMARPRVQPATQTRSPLLRTENEPQGRNQPGQSNHGVDNVRTNIPFLIKKQKRNVILDDGNEDIPFSAAKDIFKYEAFVTNIEKGTNLSDIKSHAARKLQTSEIFLKPMSKPGASYISFGFFCRSEKNDLNLKMRGLWPKYTRIYKWNSKARDTEASSRVTSSDIRRRSGDNQGSRYNTSQYNATDRYRLPRNDQRRLHSQHV